MFKARLKPRCQQPKPEANQVQQPKPEARLTYYLLILEFHKFNLKILFGLFKILFLGYLKFLFTTINTI